MVPNARTPRSSGGASPFDRLRPVAMVAVGYALATVVWVSAGGALPGGRWLSVHLFTLGVVTNLVLGLTDHFTRALTHQPGAMPIWQLVATNAGILAVLSGIPSGGRWLVGVGATVVTAMVLVSYRRQRRLRRTALGPRFGWVVRMYERAHGAFVHGALLGALIGTGVLAGRWIVSARIAHLHVNLLGWAGLTLLATVVFFGPTVGRTRIRPGADVRAAGALRLGATTLTITVLALLMTGFAGPAATVFRLVAAAGLVIYAWSVSVVCGPVARAMLASRQPSRWSVLATVAWFPVVAWVDVAVVATGRWRWLEPLGAAMLLGVLAQAIAAALGYLAPQLRPSGPARETVRERSERWGAGRALAWNAGVALVVAAAIAGPSAAEAWVPVARLGWILVLVAVLTEILLLATARWAAPGLRHAATRR